MRRTGLAMASVLALAAGGSAWSQGAPAPFTVAESGRAFGSLAEAVASLNGGDGTIRIAPGRYHECAVQESGRVSFVADQPGSVVFDHAICEGKATLVLRGTSSRVDGIIFTGTFVNDGNGAGIRIEQGDLTVSNSMFVDGQCGILSANEQPNSSISVDHSTFSGLGKDPTGNGAHSLYIGSYGSLTVTASRFERGTGGHYLKSRAAHVQILDNSFDDTQGHTTNYLIDLSNGATGRIAGNTFVDGPDKENHSTMITVAPEGIKNSSAGLVVENNRASLAAGFQWSTAFVGNWSGEAIVVRNNQLDPKIEAVATRWF